MSDFFADEPDQPEPQPPHRDGRRSRPLVLTLVVMAALIVGFSLFSSIWTEKLWFSSTGYGDVFSTLLLTKISLFAIFGLLMALVVGGNIFLAYRLRPMFRPNSMEQANLDRYREVITPIRKVALIVAALVFGIFAGASASGQWRTYLLWQHRQSFGQKDAYFHKDAGFYVFSLPWYHWLVDFLMTAVVIGLIAAVLVHYVYGGIRLQSRTDRISGAAQAQLSALLGVLVLLKGVDYYLDRFDLTSAGGGLVTGMTNTRDHAVLPSKNILMVIAVICAVLFFANIVRRTWLLPGVGLALFALSAVLLGAVWPGLVQQFQVKPNEPDKEALYIENNIKATRTAFDVADAEVTRYDAKTKLSQQQLAADAASLPGIRLLDPFLVSSTFDQLQQVRAYYTVPGVLDVDRYQINGQERDVVIAAREMHLAGLPAAQKKWANQHTVYTHGYGVIAAYGNQADADGNPVWAEQQIPPEGVLSGPNGDGYRPQIYFGENSPEYSIVGKVKGGKDVELDIPQNSGDSGDTGVARNSTYEGKDGVKIGSTFRKLLYAVKFGEPKFLLSSRVNANSKLLYVRSPIRRLEKVAPWLTVDRDALPAVVDGKVVWILDGYTTTGRYPNAEKRSLREMISDSITPRSPYASLPTDNINYMRNAVKATVDAYDGTVTLYAWDESDPILKAWQGAFPDAIKPRKDIPEDLLQHFRYPEDLYKVQRNILADYHVTDPKTFYEDSDKWQVPQDPNEDTRTQPPYRLSVATKSGSNPVFSLTSVYVPTNKQNLAAYMSVGADAAEPDSYGKFQILRLPDTNQVSGPSQIANKFNSDDAIANSLLAFKRAGTQVRLGNLLTLPVGGGLLYVQPVYTIREGGTANYPTLRFVLASFGNSVGIGSTLREALDNVVKGGGEAPSESPETPQPGTPSTPGGPTTGVPQSAVNLLQQAETKFGQAETALKAGDLEAYAARIKEGQKLVSQALTQIRNASASPSATPTPTPTPSGSPTASPTS
ncbi:MAG: UPF0182 family protein [Nocardioidaceae bacterium]|nr:UPF0182 family protein [Nocardioidaceae bacterium]